MRVHLQSSFPGPANTLRGFPAQLWGRWGFVFRLPMARARVRARDDGHAGVPRRCCCCDGYRPSPRLPSTGGTTLTSTRCALSVLPPRASIGRTRANLSSCQRLFTFLFCFSNVILSSLPHLFYLLSFRTRSISMARVTMIKRNCWSQ